MPPGYADAPGNYYSTIFGGLPGGKMQVVTGSAWKTELRSIDKVYFRRDPGHDYRNSDGGGRSWREVFVVIATTNGGRDSNNWYRRNGSGTKVYDGNWSWPTKTGRETRTGWTDIAIPFRQPWLYSGTKDLLLDFYFDGGKLANGSTWPRDYVKSYRLDGLRPTGLQRNYARVDYQTSRCFAIAGKNVCFYNCVDSSYLPLNPNQTYRRDMDAGMNADSNGKSVFWAATFHAKPKSPVALMISVGGYSTGVNIGARCNRLWLNPSMATALLFRQAGTYGTAAFDHVLPYQEGWAGMNVWMQAGYDDSVTGKLNLTTAARLTLPEKPAEVVTPFRTFLYASSDSTGGLKQPTESRLASRQPLMLFRYQ